MDKVIAHRGASAYAPENTIAAFNTAFSMGARWIEFDVMLSADGEPYVFHDNNLKRTTNGRGEFGQVQSDYIHSLDAGRWFARRYSEERIPHFADVLNWLTFADMQANIEIKPYPGTNETTAARVMTDIHRYWPKQKTLPLVSSFEYDVLRFCRSLNPELPLGFLMHEWNQDWQGLAEDIQAVSVHCNRKILSEQRVASIKAGGFQCLAYTVNRKRQALKLFSWGVDAIFSDYPDLLS